MRPTDPGLVVSLARGMRRYLRRAVPRTRVGQLSMVAAIAACAAIAATSIAGRDTHSQADRTARTADNHGKGPGLGPTPQPGSEDAGKRSRSHSAPASRSLSALAPGGPTLAELYVSPTGS